MLAILVEELENTFEDHLLYQQKIPMSLQGETPPLQAPCLRLLPEHGDTRPGVRGPGHSEFLPGDLWATSGSAVGPAAPGSCGLRGCPASPSEQVFSQLEQGDLAESQTQQKSLRDSVRLRSVAHQHKARSLAVLTRPGANGDPDT